MSTVKYMREGRGVCKKCARECDVLVPSVPGWFDRGIAQIARHLNRIEEITAKGVKPEGFCPGSLGTFDPVKPVDRRGNK